MTTESSSIVQRLWNYCNVLRDDGVSFDEIMRRDKVSLDIFWLKDESLEDTDNLPDPDILAKEIVENLESALMQFESIVDDLGEE